MKYIYHHLGLGDHIICNGIVRHFKNLYNQVSVFVKPSNFENVEYMYRDDKNIILLPIGEDFDVNQYIYSNNIKDKVILVGFNKLSLVPHNKFDEGFYKTVNLPFSYRFDKFYYERNTDEEKKIYQKLNPNNEKYIFTHGINKNKIKTNYKIIDNPTEYKIFDLLYLIENAEEVHVMESSIKNLINSYKLEKPKFYFHQYSRNYTPYNHTQGLNNFTFIY